MFFQAIIIGARDRISREQELVLCLTNAVDILCSVVIQSYRVFYVPLSTQRVWCCTFDKWSSDTHPICLAWILCNCFKARFYVKNVACEKSVQILWILGKDRLLITSIFSKVIYIYVQYFLDQLSLFSLLFNLKMRPHQY